MVWTNRDMFQFMCANAPDPDPNEIVHQMKMDKMRNPYNDSNKPKLRDSMEIIVDYRIAFAKMLLDKSNALAKKENI